MEIVEVFKHNINRSKPPVFKSGSYEDRYKLDPEDKRIKFWYAYNYKGILLYHGFIVTDSLSSWKNEESAWTKLFNWAEDIKGIDAIWSLHETVWQRKVYNENGELRFI
jgi:hypothetical protein